jgi:hypothetical protein
VDDGDAGTAGDDEVLGPAVGSERVVVEGAEVPVVGTTTVLGVDVEGADVDVEVATLVDVVVLEVGGACVVVIDVVEELVGVDVDVVDAAVVEVAGRVVGHETSVVVVVGVQFPCPVDVFRCPFDHTPNTVRLDPEYTTGVAPDGPIEPECPRFVVNVIGIGSLFTIVHVDVARSVHEIVVWWALASPAGMQHAKPTATTAPNRKRLTTRPRRCTRPTRTSW